MSEEEKPSPASEGSSEDLDSDVNDRTQKREPGQICRAIKLGIVGDGTVGKTTLLISYTARAFLDDYVPTLFDNFAVIEEIDGRLINVILWDTAGQEDYTQLRTTCYKNTDVFLLCFSTVHQDSFDNVKHKWIVELKQNAPNTPYILVGTKTDLRDKMTKEELKDAIDAKKGKARAKELKARSYVECTAKDNDSVCNVFREAIRIITDRDAKRREKDRKMWKKEEAKEKKMEEKINKMMAKQKLKEGDAQDAHS
mmetsp:Transcript_37477/g.94166  ORF Transcript_37477/g.94166 Transcript_37477/m.94166 type:complete len:254 (-) Transcript_37477:183-944(-)|eukprot:CAMPEP_0177661948 /NCGR_PEP_ID=MMETSP0447-20121125/18999_1 /TAXON_ID=0 /ORGANISM="Stygamoeba regulata, Strain BSH-02190019" /LENGTH=253 /DNA_ID=CAMNT_0019167421 /DNA_START=515 /DNA_END=1276 /DNA_ORIENTATION=-